MRYRYIAFIAAASAFMAVESTKAETRTYRFVADGSLPYTASCGECAPPYLGAKADLEGAITVALDFETSTGALIALEDQLVNVFDVLLSPGGTKLQSNPQFPNSGIIPSFAPYYEPPHYGAIHYVGNAVVLESDGRLASPDDLTFSTATPFSFTMVGREATLDMTVPLIDYYITVTGARAILIPEHTSISLAAVAATAFLCNRPWPRRKFRSARVS